MSSLRMDYIFNANTIKKKFFSNKISLNMLQNFSSQQITFNKTLLMFCIRLPPIYK